MAKRESPLRGALSTSWAHFRGIKVDSSLIPKIVEKLNSLLSVGSTPSKDRARPLIDGDHAVGGRRRASCHVANVVGAGAPNKLVALVAAQWWRRCGCRCGRCRARALS